jgi:DNA-binding response OmpR family regulator
MATILLLEDDALLNEHYTLHLRGAGHTVIPAHNSKDVVQLAADNDPDLIITDLIMPDHEGLEGIFKIRRVCEVPIMAISVNATFLKMAASLVQATLLKPVSGDELRITAEHVLAGKSVENGL